MKYILFAAVLLAPAAPAWPRAGGGGGGGGGGGCFPAGTMISAAAGRTPIEDLRPGDKVLAYDDGRLAWVSVLNCYSRRARLLTITSGKYRLLTTGEHPLLTPGGFAAAGTLAPGREIGMLSEGRLVWVKIGELRYGDETGVYNLEVAPPHTFIAEGFIVHNKGGGGGYSSRGGRYRGGSGDISEIAVFLILFVAAGLMKLKTAAPGSSSEVEKLYSRGAYENRAAATAAILRSLAAGDPAMDPAALEAAVKRAFMGMQLAWQARDYSSLKDRMMPGLYAGHSAKVELMRAQGRINMMENVTVKAVDFVHVRCPADPAARSFTALITASAADYTIDETDNSLLSGSREARTFQEFWTFQLLNGAWVPARIDQTSEDYILTAPNLPAVPGPAGSPAVTQAAAAGVIAEGTGPAAQGTSGVWDRQKMEIAATLTFESVYGAWGKNDGSLLKAEFVSAEALEKLKRLMEARRAEGLSFEFNSMFTRRAEIVLTSPAVKSKIHLDEFTARITANAVRAMLRNGRPLHRDEASHPFTEYWVFGRQNDDWKLRDILPRMEQESPDTAQDGAPSPVQIEWYWKN